MAILTFMLGALLLAAGGYTLYLSVDLVPTEMGRLYALSGVIFLCSASAIWAIGLLIVRLDRIVAAPRARAAERQEPPVETAVEATEAEPEVVARYNAGGGNYVLLSNGAIEAETPEGGMRFASMEEFRAYVAARKS
jgi:hypothetical protein